MIGVRSPLAEPSGAMGKRGRISSDDLASSEEERPQNEAEKDQEEIEAVTRSTIDYNMKTKKTISWPTRPSRRTIKMLLEATRPKPMMV